MQNKFWQIFAMVFCLTSALISSANAFTVNDLSRYNSTKFYPNADNQAHLDPNKAAGPQGLWRIYQVIPTPDGGSNIVWVQYNGFAGYRVGGLRNFFRYKWLGTHIEVWHIGKDGKLISKSPEFWHGKGWDIQLVSPPNSKGDTTIMWGLENYNFQAYLESLQFWTIDATGQVISKGPIYPQVSGSEADNAWLNADDTINFAVLKDDYNNPHDQGTSPSHFHVDQYTSEGTLISAGPNLEAPVEEYVWSPDAAPLPQSSDYIFRWTDSNQGTNGNYSFEAVFTEYHENCAVFKKYVHFTNPGWNIANQYRLTQDADGNSYLIWDKNDESPTTDLQIWKINPNLKDVTKCSLTAPVGYFAVGLTISPNLDVALSWESYDNKQIIQVLDQKLQTKSIGASYDLPVGAVPALIYAPDGTLRADSLVVNDEYLDTFSALGDVTASGPAYVYPDSDSEFTAYFTPEENLREWIFGPLPIPNLVHSYVYFVDKDPTGKVVFKSPVYTNKL